MRRKGFTLLEITIAISILVVILGVVVNSLVGANRAQGAAVTPAFLKAGGQRGMKNLYLDLSQSRKLIASPNGTSTPDLPMKYYALMDIQDPPSPLATASRVFPQISEKGSFGMSGTAPGQLDPGSVGNALMFVRPGPKMILDDAHVWISGHQLSDIPYELPTYQFVLYHLVQVPLPTGASKINGGTFTLQLIRWESKPYLQRSELQNMLNKLELGDLGSLTATGPFVGSINSRAPGIAGTWDPNQSNPGQAFVTFPTPTINLGLPPSISWNSWGTVASPTIAMNRQTWVVTTNLTGYATPMIAFNTSGNPNFAVPGLDVPAYASSPTSVPYGFETAIAGPIGARTVLFRMALAARQSAGNSFFGLAMQDVVRVFDM